MRSSSRTGQLVLALSRNTLAFAPASRRGSGLVAELLAALRRDGPAFGRGASDSHDPGAAPEPVDARAGRLAPLVRRAQAGDEEAWDLLTREFTPMLRRMAGAHGLTRQEVDDVVQTTWLRAISQFGEVDPTEGIGAWLVTIAHDETVKATRKRRPSPSFEYALEGGEDPDVQSRSGDDTAAALRAALERLSPRDRQLLQLYFQPELSYAEISAQLGVPVGSIGPMRARALARLRRDRKLAEFLATRLTADEKPHAP